MLRIFRVVPAATLLLLVACQPPPSPPLHVARALSTRVLARVGPALPMGDLVASTDIDGLRAQVDALRSDLLARLAAGQPTFQCQPPYEFPSNGQTCWPGANPAADSVLVGMDLGGAFCTTVSAPQAFLRAGREIRIELTESHQPGCVQQGVVAGPSTGLLAIDVNGVAPGLYRVDYLIQDDGDAYQSEATYVSLPALPVADLRTEEAAEEAAIRAAEQPPATGLASDEAFAVARIPGGDLGAVCPSEPAAAEDVYVVTYWVTTPHRRLLVVDAVADGGVFPCSSRPA